MVEIVSEVKQAPEPAQNSDGDASDQGDDMDVPSEPPREHDPVWRGIFPSRNTFTFADSGLVITSAFEGGNLFRCVQSDMEPLPLPTEKEVEKKITPKKNKRGQKDEKIPEEVVVVSEEEQPDEDPTQESE